MLLLLLQELKGIEEQLKSAEESSGDMEVLDALIAKEKFYARIGAKAEAYKAADEVSAGCRAAEDGDAWQPVAPVRKFTHLQASWLDASEAPSQYLMQSTVLPCPFGCVRFCSSVVVRCTRSPRSRRARRSTW